MAKVNIACLDILGNPSEDATCKVSPALQNERVLTMSLDNVPNFLEAIAGFIRENIEKPDPTETTTKIVVTIDLERTFNSVASIS